jgi:hypothetical protein
MNAPDKNTALREGIRRNALRDRQPLGFDLPIAYKTLIKAYMRTKLSAGTRPTEEVRDE